MSSSNITRSNKKKTHSSIQKPEQPQRNFVLKSSLDIVSDNKALLDSADLTEPLPFSEYFKGVL